ncbi:MAG TPA: hypothetical protein PK313_16180, partial [Myxococcota bacterium]|nr:hypothetical protein [Myxococcota bacterium]
MPFSSNSGMCGRVHVGAVLGAVDVQPAPFLVALDAALGRHPVHAVVEAAVVALVRVVVVVRDFQRGLRVRERQPGDVAR